jgi:hypothetical protein
MDTRRRCGAVAREASGRMCAFVALFGLLLMVGQAHAADFSRTRTRAHRGAQSAGVTRTRARETALARRRSRLKRGEHASVTRGRTVRGSRKIVASRKAVSARGRREARALSRRERERQKREVAGVKKPDADQTPAEAHVTVADFVRAAEGDGMASGKSEAAKDAGRDVARAESAEGAKTAVAAKTASRERAEVRDVRGVHAEERGSRRDVAVTERPKAVVAAGTPGEREAREWFAAHGAIVAGNAAVAEKAAVQAAPEAPKHEVSAVGVVYAGAPAKANVLADASNARKAATAEDAGAGDREQQQQEMVEAAVTPLVTPLYTRAGRLIMPPPMKGTRAVLVHQNMMADKEGLTRIQDDADLNRMRAERLLLPLEDTRALDVSDELPSDRRCARPWTVKFVNDIARSYYAKFHEPLRLDSAVRTVNFQLRLQRVNGNAAAVDGDTASPHLTGQAIDFGKKGMSREEVAWMRDYLLPMMEAGKIDVEEEFQQACFHISVYESYVGRRGVLRQDVAEVQ